MAYATVDELAVALNVRVTPALEQSMQACLDAATIEIDHEVDRTDPIPVGDALANRICILRGVEWYKSNAAAFGVIGFDQTGALTAPRDGFSRHAFALTPLKQKWGVA